MYHDPTYVSAEIDYRRAQIIGDTVDDHERSVSARFGRSSRIRWKRADGH